MLTDEKCLTSYMLSYFSTYSKKNWELLKELVRTKFYKSYEMTLNFLSLGESRPGEGEMDIFEHCLGPAYDFLHFLNISYLGFT